MTTEGAYVLPDHEPECPWMDGDPTRCTCPPAAITGQSQQPLTRIGQASNAPEGESS